MEDIGVIFSAHCAFLRSKFCSSAETIEPKKTKTNLNKDSSELKIKL